jgi:large subunit ribosomal protein L17
MRHRVSSKRLKRTSGELKALLKNQAGQLFERGSVTTTLPKAKILRPFAEKLVTLAKDTSFNNVKRVKAVLVNDSVVRTLFEKVSPGFLQRPGGYTRIVKLGVRQGDNASMARIEFVERAEPAVKKAVKAKAASKKATSPGKEGKKVSNAKN